jgi:hypothetical protein
MDTLASNYWDARYAGGGNSGDGSYGKELAAKIQLLCGLPNIQAIAEVGCGDFNLSKNLLAVYPWAKYTGQDISRVAIRLNQQKYPDQSFVNTLEELPPADLLLCIDVLFHVLDEAELTRLLTYLRDHFTHYLAITAYERDEDIGAPHLKVRKFDPNFFGIPVIRELIDEKAGLYFYLFEKAGIDLTQVSCCLITKENTYPKVILDEIAKLPFGEIAILTHCDSPHRKQELFAKAKFDMIYYQDDDCLAPITQLAAQAESGIITCAMKPRHLEAYKNSRIALVGWGSFIPKAAIKELDRYRAKYGEDLVFKRETERIMTFFNYPQKRLDLPITDLPSALAPDRLSMQPGHYDFILIVEERCGSLL